MIHYTTANAQTRLKAIQLSINTFKSNMGEQFTLLFSPKNQKHMFLGLDKTQVVSMVNYFPTQVTVDGTHFLVASIGSVCTHEAYRGQNIASQLLKNAEQQMLLEGVDFTIISGSGGIYERFGAIDVGYLYRYRMPKSALSLNQAIQIRPYRDDDFEAVYKLYQQEKRRYLRTKAVFKQLLISQRTPDEDCDYPMFVVEESNRIVGYLIMNHTQNDSRISIKEFAGHRHRLQSALLPICEHFNVKSIELLLDFDDCWQDLLPNKNRKRITQEASIRIIHRLNFIDKINNMLDKCQSPIRVSYDQGYKVYDGAQSSLLDETTFMKWVFNGESIAELKGENPSCLPLRLPSSHNLNYQ